MKGVENGEDKINKRKKQHKKLSNKTLSEANTVEKQSAKEKKKKRRTGEIESLPSKVRYRDTLMSLDEDESRW